MSTDASEPEAAAVPSAQQQFRCSGCAATLSFSATAGKLKCEYCDTETEIPAAGAGPQAIIEHDLDDALASKPPQRGLGRPMQSVSCQNCGAMVQVAPDVAADRCDFCGSPRVAIAAADESTIRPESLVPFAIDRDGARSRFRQWLAGLWFRPNDLQKFATVREIAGVYVPYWTFDANVDSRWAALSGYHYWETETYTTVENGQTVTKTRQVQKTRWVPSSGARSDDYDDVLVCGSCGLPQDLVNRLDTFDTGKLNPYAPEYLSGWKAERYGIDLPAAWTAAHDRMCASQYSRCGGDVPGDTHMNLSVSNRFDNKTFKHILLPIWIAAFNYRDKVFRFLVNGQTGEVEGKAPLSFAKIALLVLGILAAAGIIALIASMSR